MFSELLFEYDFTMECFETTRRFRVPVHKHDYKICFRIVAYNTITNCGTEHDVVVSRLSTVILKVLGSNVQANAGIVL
jgi:hypothetical protein